VDGVSGGKRKRERERKGGKRKRERERKGSVSAFGNPAGPSLSGRSMI